MASSRRHVTFDDWRGGLVLPRNEASNITTQGNERNLLEATGVDVLRTGGVTRRRRITGGSVLPGAGEALMTLDFGIIAQNLVPVGTAIYYAVPGAFTTIGMTQTASTGGVTHGYQFNSVLYIVNGTDHAIKWDGITATRLTTPGYNDNLAAPAGGKFPKCKIATVHQGSMFVVDYVAGNVNRLRWSHPNTAEDWRTNDYIDIDVGRDGDVITGLASLGDRLLIFKRSSIYALLGFDADTYQVVQLADGHGGKMMGFPLTIHSGSNNAVADGVVYFASDDGIFAVGGSGSVIELNPLTSGDTSAAISLRNTTDMVFQGGRLWVSTSAGIFAYDPATKAWVMWDERRCDDLATSLTGVLALGNGTEATSVLSLDTSAANDTILGVTTTFTSAISTVWIDLGMPSVKKRWKGPKIRVNSPSVNFQFVVSAYADFSTTPLYSTTVTCPTAGTQFLTGLSGMGSARAVRLRISANAGGDYVIDSITLPYNLRDSR